MRSWWFKISGVLLCLKVTFRVIAGFETLGSSREASILLVFMLGIEMSLVLIVLLFCMFEGRGNNE